MDLLKVRVYFSQCFLYGILTLIIIVDNSERNEFDDIFSIYIEHELLYKMYSCSAR